MKFHKHATLKQQLRKMTGIFGLLMVPSYLLCSLKWKIT